MILSDRTIREYLLQGRIGIDPIDYKDIQPSSIDLHLGYEFIRCQETGIIDTLSSARAAGKLVGEKDYAFIIEPGQFALGTTVERISVPDDLVARIEGKSSLGRLGLMVHITAGFVDPGFQGQLTLELYNVNKSPIVLHPGMKIAQISFMKMTTPADRPYGTEGLGSHYQNQEGPTPSISEKG